MIFDQEKLHFTSITQSSQLKTIEMIVLIETITKKNSPPLTFAIAHAWAHEHIHK